MDYAPFPISLRQLQYVVAVAETKNFRRAAERCHVSQPSLSSQIAALETALGGRLFERDQRGVLITKAGEAVLRRARAVLVEARDLVETSKHYADPLVGTLRLGVIPTLGPYLVPEIDPALRCEFDGLSILWTEDKTEALIERIAHGKLDGAFLALEGELGDVDIALVGQDPFVFACAKTHALARGKGSVKLQALRDQHVLLLDDGHCFRNQALEFCSAAGAAELGFRATSLATLVQMVASGTGVTLLPKIALDVENRNGLLAVRQIAPPAPSRTIVLAWRRGSGLADALRALATAARVVYAASHPGSSMRSKALQPMVDRRNRREPRTSRAQKRLQG
jgi:LysR family hydrogen peroxide-inducible transcriptional activator